MGGCLHDSKTPRGGSSRHRGLLLQPALSAQTGDLFVREDIVEEPRRRTHAEPGDWTPSVHEFADDGLQPVYGERPFPGPFVQRLAFGKIAADSTISRTRQGKVQ